MVLCISTRIPKSTPTLMAMMGRQSAYTGKFVTWDEIMASEMKLGPETYEFGPVPGIPETPPVAGSPA